MTFTGRIRISFLKHSCHLCLTDSERIWAGTIDKWMFSCSTTFLVLLLFLAGFLANKSVSPTCLIVAGIWTDLGRRPSGGQSWLHLINAFTDKLNGDQLPVLLLTISLQSFDIPVLAHTMSGFSIYHPQKLYPQLQQSINKRVYLTH